MRGLLCVSIALAVLGQPSVRAQSPAGVELSGIYVGQDPYAQPEDYPFTAEGQRAQDAHDPYAGDPSQYDCVPETMPQALLWGTTVIELSQETDAIVMRIERGATVRTIHLNESAPAEVPAPSDLGYSVGRWDGDVLIVETTRLTGSVLDAEEGHPVSAQARLIERYWRNAGETDLQMELVIDDPVYYTEPLTIERAWIFSPEEQIHPYDCFSLELDETAPVDMDELKRRLEQL